MKESRHTVSKSWGFEDWIVNNESYCGKRLYVIKDKKCSFHYHPIKEETFYLQSGKILLEYGETDDITEASTIILEPGDSFHLVPFTRHRFNAMQDSLIFEFSTKHDDNDVVRVIPS